MLWHFSAAGLEPHPHHQHQGSLFSAMTSLVMGGGHGGRRKKAGAKGAQWLTELSEVVTQCTIVCEVRVLSVQAMSTYLTQDLLGGRMAGVLGKVEASAAECVSQCVW
jgi:hypothetical protein